MIDTSKYWLVDSLEKFQDVINYLAPVSGHISVDTECTSAYPQVAKLIGISLSMNEGEAFYIKFAEFNGTDYKLVEWDHEIRQGMIDLLENSNKKIIMFNAVYDTIILEKNIGLNAEKQLHADVILMKHLLDEEPPHALKFTAVKYLGAGWDEGQTQLEESVIKNGGRWTAENKDMYLADLDVMSKYACADADMTLRLFHLFETEIRKQNLADFFYNKETMPLNRVVIEMHRRGIRVDIDYYKQLNDELTKEAIKLEEDIHTEIKNTYPKYYEQMEKELLDKNVPLKSSGTLFEEMYEAAGYPLVYNPKTSQPTFTKKVVESAFADDPNSALLQWKLGKLTDDQFVTQNTDMVYSARVSLFKKAKDRNYVVNVLSNDQLGELLFTYIGEVAIKKTKKGRNQIDESVIESFGGKFAFIDLILSLRKVNKLLNTYVKAALNQNYNGVIHPSWMQFGTTSGRFSSREPNYQNLPRDDKRIKRGIIAREGYVFVGADYSQLEPRCFAHCSNEKALIDSYIRGDDLYSTIAVRLFGLDCEPSEVKSKYPNERQICKTIALAVTYGAKEWKVAKILKTTTVKAKKTIDKYFKDFPNLEMYIKSCHGQVVTYGKVINETGRVRHLQDIFRVRGKNDKALQNIYRNYLNLSVNFPIQSLAASIVNRAMIAMDKEFRDQKLDARVLMQVHDEIIVECPLNLAQTVQAIVQKSMENSYKLKLPLVAEPKIASNLAETK